MEERRRGFTNARPAKSHGSRQNGDLWIQVERHVKAKNPEAVTFTKQKGHATQQMVDDGKVKEEDKEGNHQSDRAADKEVVEGSTHTHVLWSRCMTLSSNSEKGERTSSTRERSKRIRSAPKKVRSRRFQNRCNMASRK